MIRFLLLILLLSTAVSSDAPRRQYLVKADLVRGLKSTEYSVYDKSGKTLLYRMESSFKLLHNVELVAYPEEEVIGKLQARIKPFLYDGKFDLEDTGTREKTAGTIQQNFEWWKDRWNIDWNGRRISMEKDAVSLTTRFFDGTNNGPLLAQFRLRLSSLFWTEAFDMLVFQDDVPDGVFLMSLAAQRHSVGRKG